MPAPSYEVTLVDADGREFPVRVFGWEMTESELWDAARVESARLAVDVDSWRPAQPVTLGAIECWNGAELKRSPV